MQLTKYLFISIVLLTGCAGIESVSVGPVKTSAQELEDHHRSFFCGKEYN